MLRRQYPFQRAHYRLAYPLRERPRLILGDTGHEVVDCSERGLRFRLPGGPFPEMGEFLQGTLVFRRGATVDVRGIVVRIQDGEVALHLTGQGVPFSLIWEEQRFLRSRYPDHFLD